MDRQAPGRVSAPGEAGISEKINKELAENRGQVGGRFLAPAMVDDTMSPTVRKFRTRVRSDDEESVASFASSSSLASTVSRGKKRKLVSLTPDVSEEMEMEVRAISTADDSAEVTRQVAEIMRVATTSSNLKGTHAKGLKDAACYITTT